MGIHYEHIIIGAGPAGLTAGVELVRHNEKPLILEATKKFGGISRTESIDGWRFDLGGHRFFSKSDRVNEFWQSILSKDDFRLTKRQSRIYFEGKFFTYPLSPTNALRNLGLLKTFKAILSYLQIKIKPLKSQDNFETWVASRFGWYLYRTFFKTYTEKVWGIDARKIQSEWAAQRIKDLSLFSAVLSAFFPKTFNKGKHTTLIDEFYYPRLGPGMMWESCASVIVKLGGTVHTDKQIVSIAKNSLISINDSLSISTSDGDSFTCRNVISSMPLKDLVSLLYPRPSSEILAAAENLRYRSFITVAIPVPITDAFSDNWIYIHSPEVKVGRIQNFGSWSKDLISKSQSCLGLEYFVDEFDEFWRKEDSEIIAIALRELRELNLVRGSTLDKGYVVRVPKAYPVYDEDYKSAVKTIKDFLIKEWPNLYSIGRNGMHRYNNQDHSMLTAMCVTDKIVFNVDCDPWSINLENEYHEETNTYRERLSPIYPKRLKTNQ